MLNVNRSTTSPVYSLGYTSFDAVTGKTTNGTYTLYNPGVTTTFEVKNGFSVSTPGFRKLKRRKLPDNPFSRGLADGRYDQMALTRYEVLSNGSWNKDTYRGPARHFGANVEQQLEPEDPYFIALNRLFNELSLTKGSLAVTLAEASKTADHIAKTATRLYKAYRGLRRGRFQEFTDALGMSVSQKEFKRVNKKAYASRTSEGNYRNFAASTWLEYTYGWKPLISDVFTQAENLANYLTERANVVRRGRGSAKKTVDKFVVSSTLPYGYPGKITTRFRAERRCSIVVKYKIAGQPSALDTFGITNPALVAWELVPFSFVVDWFLPIGNFLESLTATNGLSFAGGTQATKTTYTIESVCQADPTPVPSSGFPRVTWTGIAGGIQKKSVKTRTLLFTFPSVPLPQLKDPRSFAHLASALSLLQAVFGKR